MNGTDTIVFIKYDDIPLDHQRHIMYGKTVVTYRPEKEDPNRTRLTVGGDQISYPGNVSTPTVEMMTVKMHQNSVISTKRAQYCTFDVKDFYLNTPMECPEFMRLKLKDLTTSPMLPTKLEQYTSQSKKECMAYHKWKF